MKVIVAFAYLIVTILWHGNSVYSELPGLTHGSANRLMDRQNFVTVFDAEINDLVDDDDLPDLVEEDFTEANENNTGRVFSKKDNLQNKYAVDLSELFVISNRFISSKFVLPGFISSVALITKSTPVYISNRVIRI